MALPELVIYQSAQTRHTADRLICIAAFFEFTLNDLWRDAGRKEAAQAGALDVCARSLVQVLHVCWTAYTQVDMCPQVP